MEFNKARTSVWFKYLHFLRHTCTNPIKSLFRKICIRFYGTSRALVIPREFSRKSIPVYFPSIFAADKIALPAELPAPICREIRVVVEGDMEGLEEGVGEFACAKLSAVCRLATGWRRFSSKLEAIRKCAFDPCAWAKDESANRGGKRRVRSPGDFLADSRAARPPFLPNSIGDLCVWSRDSVADRVAPQDHQIWLIFSYPLRLNAFLTSIFFTFMNSRFRWI